MPLQDKELEAVGQPEGRNILFELPEILRRQRQGRQQQCEGEAKSSQSRFLYITEDSRRAQRRIRLPAYYQR